MPAPNQEYARSTHGAAGAIALKERPPMSTPMAATAPAAPPAAPVAASAGAPDRDRIELLIALALLHAEHGQPRRALTYALLAQTFAPADPLARRMLAFALLRNGAAAEALETLEPLVDPMNPTPEIDLLRAEALSALDRSEAATDAFWRAVGARAPAADPPASTSAAAPARPARAQQTRIQPQGARA
jgi:Flp pilus assembly protein TadD